MPVSRFLQTLTPKPAFAASLGLKMPRLCESIERKLPALLGGGGGKTTALLGGTLSQRDMGTDVS